MLQPTRRYVRSRYDCTWLYVIYCNWMGLSIWIGIWKGSWMITQRNYNNSFGIEPRNFNPRAHIETDGDSMANSRLALHVSPVGASYGRQMMCIVLLTFWDVYDSYDEAELAIGKAHSWSWRDCRAIVTFTWKPMNMVSALVDLCWFDPCTRFSPGRDVHCHLQPDSTLLQGSGHVDVARFLCEAGADKEPSDHPVAVTWSSLMIWFLRTKLQRKKAKCLWFCDAIDIFGYDGFYIVKTL